MTPAISIKKLTKIYANNLIVLDKINLDIKKVIFLHYWALTALAKRLQLELSVVLLTLAQVMLKFVGLIKVKI